MNTLLEQKIQQAKKSYPGLLLEKDIAEINQIFSILNNKKQIEFITNFDRVVLAIQKVKAEMIEIQKMYFEQAITNIENAVIQKEKEMVNSNTKKTIDRFKTIV